MILIHSNPAFVAEWAELTEDQRRALGRGHAAFHEEVAASGELVVAEGLADPATARHVAVRDGRTLVTDGPFAETKEHLAGFYLLECTDIDRAVELAARVPDAEFGHVEVRPVLDLGGLEL
ncbi:YciI family protein [Actinokineospora sp. NBRC 105648]|uniref:YciI family protein n=1 Tax=Actinokineospora sp. NBRC 105648 TaxID=3032206 RepID=UPI00332D52E6